MGSTRRPSWELACWSLVGLAIGYLVAVFHHLFWYAIDAKALCGANFGSLTRIGYWPFVLTGVGCAALVLYAENSIPAALRRLTCLVFFSAAGFSVLVPNISMARSGFYREMLDDPLFEFENLRMSLVGAVVGVLAMMLVQRILCDDPGAASDRGGG